MVDPWRRGRALRSLAIVLGEAAEPLAEALVADLGMTARHAREHEVDGAVALARAFDPAAPFPVHPAIRLGERGPVGSVAALLAPRAPLIDLVRVVAAAFAAGNTGILVRLPARLARAGPILRELFPGCLPGVRFDAAKPEASGGDAAFVDRALADPFTRVLFVAGAPDWLGERRAAVRRSRTRVVFEGPGNDPLVVLPDADLDAAALAAVRSARAAAAGDPAAVGRVHVHARVHDALVERLARAASLEKVGPAADPATTVGPAPSAEAAARVRWQLSEALERGAAIRAGGVWQEVPGNPRETLHPTVVTGCAADMPLVAEPTPAAALPVLAFADDAELLAQLDAVGRGYAASLWGGSSLRPALARRFGRVCVNGVATDEPELRLDWGGRAPTSWVWSWSGTTFVERSGPRDLVVEFSRPLFGAGR